MFYHINTHGQSRQELISACTLMQSVDSYRLIAGGIKNAFCTTKYYPV